jgi:hypothetical protein
MNNPIQSIINFPVPVLAEPIAATGITLIPRTAKRFEIPTFWSVLTWESGLSRRGKPFAVRRIRYPRG